MVYTSLEVKRVCCGSCGHIHAVPPGFYYPPTPHIAYCLFSRSLCVRSCAGMEVPLTTQYHFRSAVDYYDFLLL